MALNIRWRDTGIITSPATIEFSCAILFWNRRLFRTQSVVEDQSVLAPFPTSSYR
jgi:hypothetical protein